MTVISYVASFYFLSLTLKTLPVGVAYAIWSCLAIVMISLAGAVWFRQMLDAPAMIGIGLIVAGVATINLFSKATTLGG